MPVDILTLLEGLATFASLVPTDYEYQFRALAASTATEMISVLETSVRRSPFSVEPDEQKRFKACKSKLFELVSNSPAIGYPLHEALKPLFTLTLSVSRSLTTGTIRKEQAFELLEQLRAHVAAHYPSNE
jgi:hypothetical protein